MVKKLLKIVFVLILLALIVVGVFFYSIYTSIDRVNLSYQTISSSKIPEDMNDLKTAFISDIKYNEYMNRERLTSMISRLNTIGAGVVIFGGDMFSSLQTKAPDSQMSKDSTTILKSIDTPLGKFAVLGDEDLANDKTEKIVSQISYDSDSGILSDTSIRFRNKGGSSIPLIGSDNILNGDPQPGRAMKKVSEDEFNILVTHCPDIVKTSGTNTKYLNLIIAGHSLGGQIYLPLLGPLYTMEGAATYSHDSYDINGTSLHISNDLGTKDIDMRLLAPPQILVFRLQHESGKKQRRWETAVPV